jgi:hypothetical protein
MTGPTQGGPEAQRPSAMRQGLWNYAMNRWAPKTQPARILVEFGILIAFFVVLAVLVKLAS